MVQYFPPGRTDLVPFPLEHISRQDLLDKMRKDCDEVAVLSASFTIILGELFLDIYRLKRHFRVMRETCELFSRESMQTGRTDPQEIRNSQFKICRKSDPNVSVEDRQSRTGSNCRRSFCIHCSVDSPPSCNFGRGNIHD